MTLVSIPEWFDLKYDGLSVLSLTYDVSIPEWFDLKEQVELVLQLLHVVSIPEWFDLKPVSVADVDDVPSFNS